MKVFYTGNYCYEELFQRIYTSQANPPSYAQQKLERLLLEGFEGNGCDVYATLMYPVRSYPGFGKALLRTKRETKGRARHIYMGMLNVLFIKHVIIFFSEIGYFLAWALQNGKTRDKCYFSYAVNPPVTLPCVLLAKLFGVKSVVLVSEHPRLRTYFNQNSMARRFLLKLFTEVSVWIYGRFDGYVILADALNDAVNSKGKPHVTVEGMIGPEAAEQPEAKDPLRFVVMYAGGINKRNGMEALLTGFMRIADPALELWLFGGGDFEKEARRLASQDGRIKCFGNVPNDEILRRQREADLLINPRPSDERFTEFSFPSKTIESMASGTPLLSTRLRGIPQEYFEYLHPLEDESAAGIRDSIAAIAARREDSRALGERARRFILEQKNNAVQTQKILDMISRI